MNSGQYSRPTASTISTLTIALELAGHVAVVLVAEVDRRAGAGRAQSNCSSDRLIAGDFGAARGEVIAQCPPPAPDLEQGRGIAQPLRQPLPT